MFGNWFLKCGILLQKLLGRTNAVRLYRVPTLRHFFHFIVRNLYDSDSTILWTVSGIKMLIPVSVIEFFIFQEYEPETVQEFVRALNEGDVVVDVGAHIGFYSLLAAEKVGETGHVYAFEPSPAAFEILNKNISINQFNNITTINKAVTNRSGVAQMLLLGSLANSLFFSHEDPDSETITVKTTSLDCFFQPCEALIPKIRMVKIDAEGAEILVLEGMRTIIRKAGPLSLICELKQETLEIAKSGAKELLLLLQELNFKIRPVCEEHETSLANLEKRAEVGGLNVICTSESVRLSKNQD
jgi:FkbM family methyltransferase